MMQLHPSVYESILEKVYELAVVIEMAELSHLFPRQVNVHQKPKKARSFTFVKQFKITPSVVMLHQDLLGRLLKRVVGVLCSLFIVEINLLSSVAAAII